MEPNALVALLEAYKISRSVDIGKLILNSYLETGEWKKSVELLQELSSSIDHESLANALVMLSEANQISLLSKLLPNLDANNLLNRLLELNKEAVAKELYTYWIQQNADIKSHYWDNRL